MSLATDLDFSILEDLDFETPCSFADEGCDSAARWSAQRRCCLHISLLCPGHKDYVIAVLEQYVVNLGGYFLCGVCKTKLYKMEDWHFAPLK